MTTPPISRTNWVCDTQSLDPAAEAADARFPGLPQDHVQRSLEGSGCARQQPQMPDAGGDCVAWPSRGRTCAHGRMEIGCDRGPPQAEYDAAADGVREWIATKEVPCTTASFHRGSRLAGNVTGYAPGMDCATGPSRHERGLGVEWCAGERCSREWGEREWCASQRRVREWRGSVAHVFGASDSQIHHSAIAGGVAIRSPMAPSYPTGA